MKDPENYQELRKTCRKAVEQAYQEKKREKDKSR